MSNLHKLCRLCLKKCRPHDNYEDLGHDYSIRCKVAVQEIFNIINGNTTFPTKVCIDCSQKVLQFYDYFVVVQKNQEILNNGVNFVTAATSSGQVDSQQTARSLPSLINLNKRSHYTTIPNVNIFAGTSAGAAPMDIDNSIDGFLSQSGINVETKPEVFSTPKPFLNFEERKAIEEKIKLIKDDMSDDEKIKIFYGLQCTTCHTSTEFNKLVEYEEHCRKEHDIEVTSFVCCKTKIKREFLIDHIEYHLGTPAVRMLRPRTRTMGPASIYNDQESNGADGSDVVSVDDTSKSVTENGTHPFPCTRCNRSYMVKSSLKRHMILSHGYTCDVCNKTFDDDLQLKKHQYIYHSTDGPFKCPICPNQEFDTRRQLYNHKRWHTRQSLVNPLALSVSDENDENQASEKPTEEPTVIDDPKIFKCSYCSGAFHSNRNLKIHMSLKHKKSLITAAKSIKRRYVSPAFKHKDLPKLRCKICGFLSLYRQNLKRHIRVRHPDEADTEEELNALFEDTSANKSQNAEVVEDHENAENDMENADKSENMCQVSQIKEEQEDSLNMFHCLSNSLLP